MFIRDRLKTVRLLWSDVHGDGVTPEPSEIRYRTWVLAILMVVVPPIVLAAYHRAMFPGLTNADALDVAQIARNLASGRGFTTLVLRPLALTHGSNPMQQPDLTHGPLYPFILALAYGVLGVRDATVSYVASFFYLATIPVLYALSVKLFSRAVGLFSVTIFTFNALMLEYATAGLDVTLYTFLMTSLLLAIYGIAENRPRDDGLPGGKPSGRLCALAGVLTALLYLTDPIFVCVAPVVFVAVYATSGRRRLPHLVALCVPFVLCSLPWMVRNAMLTGNPVFGLRGSEVWMETPGFYPALQAYRSFPTEFVPGIEIFRAVAFKIMLGVGTIIQHFPDVTASWILAFFLPCLLFRFSSYSTNVVRRTMVYCLIALIAGSLCLYIQMPIFVAIIPAMLVFSVAYLLHLVEQAQLRSAPLATLGTLLAVAVLFPLLSATVLNLKPHQPKELAVVRMLATNTRPTDISLSDQPWLVAWFADRPSIWLPANDSRIADVRRQFPQVRTLFLTEQTQLYSPSWHELFNLLAEWNVRYTLAALQKKPLKSLVVQGKIGDSVVDELTGLASVPPPKGATESTAAAAVIAALPESGDEKIGMRPTADATVR